MSVYTFAAIERRVKLFNVEAESRDAADEIAKEQVAVVDMNRNVDSCELDVEFESSHANDATKVF